MGKRIGAVCILALSLALLASCASPERKAAKAQQKAANAQADVSSERLKLVDQYKACVNDAGNDAAKVDACDTYLKAAEALQ